MRRLLHVLRRLRDESRLTRLDPIARVSVVALLLVVALYTQPLPVVVINARGLGIERISGPVSDAPDLRLLAFLAPLGPGSFIGGNVAVADLYALARMMAKSVNHMTAPAAGGTLTVNGVGLGSYDYVIKSGPITIATFTNGDWFTTTDDSRSAFLVVKGDLTINGGQTVIPSNRKLFTCLYVTGNLIVNGQLSMTQRGANHSVSGSNLAAGNILIASGTHGGEVSPTIAAAGTAGGAAAVDSTNLGVGGTVAANGAATTPYQTQGGTSGYALGAVSQSGAGVAGTSFSSGPGGGEATGSTVGGGGNPNGGPGGNGTRGAASGAGGGAGNPGGAPDSDNPPGSGAAGGTGTGGVLVVLVEGTVSGSGSMTASGVSGGADGFTGAGGGGSGGGCIAVFHRGSFSTVTLTATGGSGGAGSAVHFSL